MSAAAMPERAEWGIPLAGLALSAAILGLMTDEALILALVAAALGATVAWIVWKDVRTLTIANSAIVTIAVLGLASRLAAARSTGEALGPALLFAALDMALAGGALFLFRELFFRLKGYDGIGFGDVKLAAAGGILVGAIGFSWALFSASALGLAYVLWRRAFTHHPVSASDRLAFGAALAPALWIVWIVEQMPAIHALS